MRLTAVFPFLAAGSIVLLGCSKNDQSSTTPADATETPSDSVTETHDGHGDGHGKHEHDFEGPVDAFHETMAPLWHAQPGEARATDTCAAVGDLISKAEAIEGAEAPEAATDASAWQGAGEGLVAAAQALEKTCNDDPAGFDDSFKAVHEAFHTLVGLVGHGEGEHEHGGEPEQG